MPSVAAEASWLCARPSDEGFELSYGLTVLAHVTFVMWIATLRYLMMGQAVVMVKVKPDKTVAKVFALETLTEAV